MRVRPASEFACAAQKHQCRRLGRGRDARLRRYPGVRATHHVSPRRARQAPGADGSVRSAIRRRRGRNRLLRPFRAITHHRNDTRTQYAGQRCTGSARSTDERGPEVADMAIIMPHRDGNCAICSRRLAVSARGLGKDPGLARRRDMLKLTATALRPARSWASGLATVASFSIPGRHGTARGGRCSGRHEAWQRPPDTGDAHAYPADRLEFPSRWRRRRC